jgi:hypothetical protein
VTASEPRQYAPILRRHEMEALDLVWASVHATRELLAQARVLLDEVLATHVSFQRPRLTKKPSRRRLAR